MHREVLFYNLTQSALEKMAPGIDLKKYYELVDYREDDEGVQTKGKTGISQVFYLMVSHSQNATMISNVIKFDENYEALNDKLFGFDPIEVCNQYNVTGPVQIGDDIVKKLVEELRPKLGWKNKENQKRPDALAKRFAATALNCAFFLKDFNSKQEVIDELFSHYAGNSFKSFMEYFAQRIPTGFSIALTCDFLKELDKKFNDLAKPDVHIIDTLSELDNNPRKYRNTKGPYACIERMREIVDIVNREKGDNITVYQLDRMIWLVCTGNFFLDAPTKAEYLKSVKKLN